MIPDHPLNFQLREYKKEVNLNKILGQITMGVVTALAVRWVVAKIDAFIGRKAQ